MWDNGVELVPSMVDGQFSSAIKLPSEVDDLKNNLVCRWTSAPIIGKYFIVVADLYINNLFLLELICKF